jgi:hypothetical protein
MVVVSTISWDWQCWAGLKKTDQSNLIAFLKYSLPDLLPGWSLPLAEIFGL